MPVLDDLGIFLQDNGFGLLGQSLFLGMIPQDAPGSGVQDQILGLFEAPGLPPRNTHDLLGPSVEMARIHLRFRGAPFGYETARGMAGEAYKLLGSVVNQTINGVFYQQITVLNGPFGMPQDEWNRPFIVVEVLCARDAQAS